MLVAILYTGSLRTIEKTFLHLKRNLLIHGDVHLYACLENDTSMSNEEWNHKLFHELEGNIKSIVWKSNKQDNDWNSIKHINVENINTHIDWAKKYLLNSGSMFEHYQMQHAYKAMVQKEYETGVNYEYVIRCRTDTIFCKPIDFHWLHYTDEQLAQIIATIRSKLPAIKDIMPHLLYGIMHEDILGNIQNIEANCKPSESYREIKEDSVSEINEYIKNGKYMLCIRSNLLYICKRSLFHLIPLLGTSYGLLQNPYADEYWWNSESQFESICYHAGLTTFNYNTEYEGKSIYQFDRNLFFDEKNEVREKSQLYCLVRN